MTRNNRRQYVPIAIIVIMLAVASQIIISAPQVEERIVTRVVDGDTIDVEGGERVRLQDIDTPERGEECYSEATNRLKELVDGKLVVLERRGEDRDVYDRLLRYVFVDDVMVNLILVREGYANLFLIDKDSPYYQQFIEAEQAAKAEQGCVWKPRQNTPS